MRRGCNSSFGARILVLLLLLLLLSETVRFLLIIAVLESLAEEAQGNTVSM